MSKEVKRNSSDRAKPKVKGWVSKTRFVESVIVDSKPAFLVKDTSTGKISVEYRILTPEGPIRPLKKEEMGYIPYEFTAEEIQLLTTKEITREEVIEDALPLTKRYVELPHRDQILITGNIILSYSLEWVNTIHFPYFVGETESGKSSVLHLGRWLNYRCFVTEDLTYAGLYNFLGTDEEGAGSICEDEAQEMSNDRKKMRAYKGSYQKGSTRPIVIMTNKGRYQVFFKTYCCKWFAGESVPQDKGLRERLVIVYMTVGKPQSSIKNASLDNEDGQTLNRIRNKILVWKIQNIEKGFPRIDSGLEGRDGELWDAFLSLFHGTKFESQAKETADYYLKQRGDTIRESLESTIFRIIKPKLETNLEIGLLEIWEMVKDSDEISGKCDASDRTIYLDYIDGTLTLNSLSKILLYKFHAKKRTRYEMVNGKKRKITSYVFDKKAVETLSKKYRIDDS